jgi:23S rRNA (guanosine2251-2'-O)-methyltransferase
MRHMRKITVVAHNIRSTHNIGAIFRTAEGFGIHKIILSGYSPYPSYDGDTRLPHISRKMTEQIHKTALGAETIVPFDHVEDLDDWIKKNDEPLIALEQASNSISINEFNPPDAFTLLIGEEVNGIETKYLDQCSRIIEIPMQGQKESFNVSVATGIALYKLSTLA